MERMTGFGFLAAFGRWALGMCSYHLWTLVNDSEREKTCALPSLGDERLLLTNR